MNKLFELFLNKTNIVIIIITIILSLFSIIAGMYNPFTIAILGLFILLISMFFDFNSNKNSVSISGKINIKKIAFQENDNIKPIIYKIGLILENLRRRQNSNSAFMQISSYFEEILKFEVIVPQLVENYRNGIKYINRFYSTPKEIELLKSKIKSSSGPSRDTYILSLKEKEQTLIELSKIKESLSDSESKLYYIMTTLEKIETILTSNDVLNNMSETDIKNMENYMEAFSNTVKEFKRIIR